MNKKFFTVAAGISIFVLILVLLLGARNNTANPVPLPNSTEPSRVELADLSAQRRRDAMVYVAAIEDKLPLYLESFATSVGIPTTINLYRLDSDEAEIVRLEIYGLSYLNADADEKKNPNVTAFKESYLKAIEMLEGQNIDPKKLIFIYGDKEYVRTTSQAWITALQLKP